MSAAIRAGRPVALRDTADAGPAWGPCGIVDSVTADGQHAVVIRTYAAVYPLGALVPLEIRRCTCGVRHVVRDLVPFATMEDGDGGTLALYNCHACHTTFAVEANS